MEGETAMTERDEMIEKAIEYENTIYLNDRRDRHELMADFALSVRPKRLTVADMRELDKKVASGKISYSRMVELINEHFGLLPELPRKEERRRNDSKTSD